jgi:hypothetical protein
MNHMTVSLRPKLFAAGLVAGLVAGWSAGCSRSSSAHVNVEQVRAALAKRRADYGETPRSQLRARDKSVVQIR